MQDLFEAKHYRLGFDEYWATLVECGWIADVPQHKHNDLRDALRKAFSREGERWPALADTGMDAECIYDIGIGVYEDKIAFLAETSGGLFSPIDIREEYDQEQQRLLISFRHGDTRFQHELRAPFSDYFNEGIIDLINQALEASNIPNRFISLPARSQVWLFALVSERAYRCAEKRGLIPPPKYYWYKDFVLSDINIYLSKYYAELDKLDEPSC